MSPSAREGLEGDGFTILEVIIATVVLTTGLLAMAALSARMMSSGSRSKYMSLAATLTSEKLEDLNRWSANDPQVCVPTGSTTAGSLTSDVSNTTTCPSGASSTVNYFDDVALGATNGTFSETVSGLSGGAAVYSTTTHSPDGTVQTSSSSTAPTSLTFHRRWVIEADQPVSGVRQITVLVTLNYGAFQPPVQFQMSMVHP